MSNLGNFSFGLLNSFEFGICTFPFLNILWHFFNEKKNLNVQLLEYMALSFTCSLAYVYWYGTFTTVILHYVFAIKLACITSVKSNLFCPCVLNFYNWHVDTIQIKLGCLMALKKRQRT